MKTTKTTIGNHPRLSLSSARTMRRRVTIATQTSATAPTALPEYIETCARYLCHQGDGMCAQSLLVPPLDEQRYILTSLHQLAMQTDIEGLQGFFIKLLIHHDSDSITRMLEAAMNYNQAMDLIRSIAAYTESLPIHMVALPPLSA